MVQLKKTKASPKKTVKPTVKKPVNKKTEIVTKATQTPKQNGISVFTWLFSPTPKFSFGKFLTRIGLFILGFIAVASLFMALSAKLQMVLQGIPMDQSTFLARLTMFPTMLWVMAIVNPFASILFLLFLTIVGGFIFMPRPKIGRHGYLATHWTSLFWMVVAGGLVTCLVYSGGIGASWLISILAAIAILGAFCTWITTARFASNINVSNWALLLSFPFGFIMYSLIGHFMPAQNTGETKIAVQYKWYDRLIKFLSGTKGGLAILGLIQIAILCIASLPGSWLIAVVFAILWATVGAAGILRNTKMLSWIAVIVNLATIVGIVLAIELYPFQLLQAAMS